VASPHSDWIADRFTPTPLRKHLPSVYDALLAPVFWMYRLVGPANAEWLAHGLGLAEASSANNLGAGYLAVVGSMLAPLVGAAVVLAKGAGRRSTAASLRVFA
jgi:hypothetical protein